ncbi:MAG TPA: hypothetical protein VN223_04190 [Candidatus Elarobacter sp.]|nr:hypothetical protein [Candidatus Elarobacter sp.]
MSTLRLHGKTRVLTVQFMFVLLVLTVQGFAQTPTLVKAPRSLRDELTHTPAETGMHSWSYEGMLSPDGTLAAFPYWEVDPCPSWKKCDVEADRQYSYER